MDFSGPSLKMGTGLYNLVQARSEKWVLNNYVFRSEIGSGFEETDGTRHQKCPERPLRFQLLAHQFCNKTLFRPSPLGSSPPFVFALWPLQCFCSGCICTKRASGRSSHDKLTSLINSVLLRLVEIHKEDLLHSDLYNEA